MPTARMALFVPRHPSLAGESLAFAHKIEAADRIFEVFDNGGSKYGPIPSIQK